MKPRWRRLVQGGTVACCVGGLLLSVPAATPVSQARSRLSLVLCGGDGSLCDTVERGSTSWVTLIPGMPPVNAGVLGCLYFSVLSVWTFVLGAPNRAGRYWHLVPMWLVVFGGMASAYLAAVMILNGTICTRCILVHTFNVAVMGGVFLLWPRAERGGSKEQTDGGLLAELCAPGARPAWQVGVLVSILSIVLAAFELLALEHLELAEYTKSLEVGGKMLTDNASVVQALYREQQLVDVPIGKDDPTWGASDAPHTLVVFADYQCHACRTLQAVLERDVLPIAGDRLRFVLKNRPLFGKAGDSAPCVRCPSP